jgi:hypothetical protein
MFFHRDYFNLMSSFTGFTGNKWFLHSRLKSISTLRYFPIYISYKITYFQNILLKSFLIRFSWYFHL